MPVRDRRSGAALANPVAATVAGPFAGPIAGNSDRAGVLTLVGTPIGNLGDLSDGALAALREAEIVCAEDTRRSRKLLSAYDLHPRMLVSVRAHNEQQQADRVIGWLAAGRRVAYVTDAGMPVLSDPGQRLVARVAAAGARVTVAPGPDAATAALLIAGWRASQWCFEGFLPVRGGGRARRLAEVAATEPAVVLFEAPHRLLRTLDDLAAAVGAERPVAVVNDLTKRYERVWRGRLGEVAAELRDAPVRGEYVIVLAPTRPA